MNKFKKIAEEQKVINITVDKALEERRDALFKLPRLADGNQVFIKLEELYEHPKHSFKLRENHPYFIELEESIKEYGIIDPLLVYKRDKGGFYIIAGHTRKFIGARNGITEYPCIIQDVTEEQAIERMVLSNINRPDWLPSERAWSYREIYESMKRQGKRTDLRKLESGTDDQLTSEAIAIGFNVSEKTLRRYIQLTYLIPELLELVDEDKIKLLVGHELSYLTKEEQLICLGVYYDLKTRITVEQANQLRERSKTPLFTKEFIYSVLLQPKKVSDKISIKYDLVKDYIQDDIEDRVDYILKALKFYSEHHTDQLPE